MVGVTCGLILRGKCDCAIESGTSIEALITYLSCPFLDHYVTKAALNRGFMLIPRLTDSINLTLILALKIKRELGILIRISTLSSLMCMFMYTWVICISRLSSDCAIYYEPVINTKVGLCMILALLFYMAGIGESQL